MLTVIAIIGIIAAISVPVLKNFGKSDVSISASRQLLDDLGRARQLAMSQRTTVYMVFVSTNFWYLNGKPDTTWLRTVNLANQQNPLTNLLDKQLTGYTFMAYGALGDQPGRHTWHYLAEWQSLPQGAYIPLWKFYNATPPFSFSDPVTPNVNFNINPFSWTNTFPFPTTNILQAGLSAGSASENGPPPLPYIAFNYLGQLSDYSGQMLTSAALNEGQDYDLDFIGGGVDIPIAQGAVIPYIDPSTRQLLMVSPSGQPGSPQVVENPPGNTTNISYNVIHIDPLTGRAILEFHKIQ